MHDIEAVLALILLAIIVAAVAGRLRTPAPSLLVVVGLGVGFLPGFPALHVSPDLVTFAVLPPLLFSGAQQISLIDLRKVWRPVAILALGLVLVTAAAVAAVAHAVDPRLSGAVAFTVGAILASTDPVAVTALSRELRLPPRVGTLVQAESLFNDATSLVLFEVAVAAAVSGHVSAPEAVGRFLVLGLGGVAVGLVSGLALAVGLRRTQEPTIQAAVALVAPYVAAVTAHAAHVSPVTAVIVAGLALGRRRLRSHHSEGRLVASAVYEVVVFVLENAIFAVIGLELASFVRDLPGRDTARTGALLATITLTLLAVRAVTSSAPLVRRRPSGDADQRPPWQVAAVVTWAGARGVIPLAAALAIPARTHSGAPFPHRPMLLVVTTGVVVVTLVVQGSTLAPLVRRLGVTTPSADAAADIVRAEHALAVAALNQLEDAADAVGAARPVVDAVRRELQSQADSSRPDEPSTPPDGAAQALRRELLATQSAELTRLRVAGEISADTFRRLQRRLDIDHTRLRE